MPAKNQAAGNEEAMNKRLYLFAGRFRCRKSESFPRIQDGGFRGTKTAPRPRMIVIDRITSGYLFREVNFSECGQT
jgi:hypothetical protein